MASYTKKDIRAFVRFPISNNIFLAIYIHSRIFLEVFDLLLQKYTCIFGKLR